MNLTSAKLWSLARFSKLRYRLLALVLIPLLLLSGSVILVASYWSSSYTYEQLFAKVHTDLRVAGERFKQIQTDGQRELSWLASSATMTEALQMGEPATILLLLDQQRKSGGFDFLKLLSSDGTKLLTPGGWSRHPFRTSPSTRQALRQTQDLPAGTGAVGIEIYQAQEWQQESGLDSNQMMLPLIPTARAAPTDRAFEDRAMVIRTVEPVLGVDGTQVALLEGGVLLNGNFEFVDEIRDLVYGPGSLAVGSRGTVTVFLEDVRITTNVPTSDDTRALGTRVSAEVRDAVLNHGERWVDRAFVVNDWYISAYEPIVDVSGERVGMLYAGFLEAPFRADLYQAIAALSGLVIAGSLLAALAAIAGARAIFRPVESMTAVVRATAAGEHQRIGTISTRGEIGELATQFDAMLDTLAKHRQQIERDSALLEDKVRHRTAELQTQNQRLQDSIDLLHQTRQQLANAEKLAALGELTAGVAHEINNPTAVILGNMDVLIADLDESDLDVQTEIDLIIQQVYRIRSITDRLLQYSRSELNTADGYQEAGDGESGFNPMLERYQHPARDKLSLPTVISESLKLLEHELSGRHISVQHVFGGELYALIDQQELQQVLVNLLTNAVHAIDRQGQITIETADLASDRVSIVIRDTGCGIEPEHLPRVFDPFFTSGKARGTGLGLSVSYGIIRRFGGDIRVQSSLTVGSEFEISLPAATADGVSQPVE